MTPNTLFSPTENAFELAQLLLTAHNPASAPADVKELARLLAERLPFSYAQPLADCAADVASGNCRNFVYDKTSRRVFFDCAPGRHRNLMAHLECLHQTGPAKGLADWARELGTDDAAVDRLADAFVERGRGLFLSSVWEHPANGNSKSKKITVGRRFNWDAAEFAAFGCYGKDDI